MEEETIPKSNRRKRMEQIWDKSDGETRIVPEGMKSSFEQISYNQFDGMQHRPETSPLCNEHNLVSQEESNCYMSDRAEMRLAYEHDLHVTTSRTAEAELVPLVCDRHLLTTTYSNEQLQMSNKSHEDAYVSIEEQSLAEFENNNTSAAVKGTGVPQSGVDKIISFAGTTTAEKHIENSQEIFEMFNHSQNMAYFEMNITTATNVGQGQENVVGEEEIELFEHNYGLTRELTPPPAVAGEELDDDITEEDIERVTNDEAMEDDDDFTFPTVVVTAARGAAQPPEGQLGHGHGDLPLQLPPPDLVAAASPPLWPFAASPKANAPSSSPRPPPVNNDEERMDMLWEAAATTTTKPPAPPRSAGSGAGQAEPPPPPQLNSKQRSTEARVRVRADDAAGVVARRRGRAILRRQPTWRWSEATWQQPWGGGRVGAAAQAIPEALRRR
ncbi:hypothetical protein HU200_062599 [Digitaria exilis]|uniref:Uncharacterized protein n=1 Tax=Digitaria exilis TaxID=1010633 RepID=A0A835A905_9POAL|nr:hypothetical protein HU200_062599 [Digitaria exilis]